MNLIFAEELASQRIRNMHQVADRDRLARQIRLTKSSRKRDLTVPASTYPAPGRSRRGRSVRIWTSTRAAVRQWFDHTHLGPVDNYVTR